MGCPPHARTAYESVNGAHTQSLHQPVRLPPPRGGRADARKRIVDMMIAAAPIGFLHLDRLERGEHDMTVIKEDAAEWTGGCQCGAVRYQLLTPPEHACICHCRMCQRASGQPFMAFASVKREDLRWTRGSPSTFVSSNVAERNFCSACGTPLTYHRVESGSIAVTIGSLDAPEAVRPIEQFGIESELSWISALRALPAKRTEDWKREYRIPRIDSHQYSA